MNRKTRKSHVEASPIAASKKKLQGTYETHWHEFYEIEYVLSGSGTYIIDGTPYPIRSGMLFFMTPQNFHSVSADDCTVYNVMFSEQPCDLRILSRLIGGKSVFDTKEDLPFFDAVFHELVQNLSDEAFAGCLLNAALGKIPSENRRTPSDPVAQGLLYLLRHFRENPSLAEVAEHVGYTPTYFSSVYKTDVGETFKQTLDRLRFDYAANLIVHSDLTVAQICKESGFEDYPNFIRRYKERFGTNPGNRKR